MAVAIAMLGLGCVERRLLLRILSLLAGLVVGKTRDGGAGASKCAWYLFVCIYVREWRVGRSLAFLNGDAAMGAYPAPVPQ